MTTGPMAIPACSRCSGLLILKYSRGTAPWQLLEKGDFHAFNLGNGGGFSVRRVFSACKKVVKSSITHTLGERRAGDPGILVADENHARTLLDQE